eukprot:746004-Amorphochlora_amoeboformis.AAC.1
MDEHLTLCFSRRRPCSYSKRSQTYENMFLGSEEMYNSCESGSVVPPGRELAKRTDADRTIATFVSLTWFTGVNIASAPRRDVGEWGTCEENVMPKYSGFRGFRSEPKVDNLFFSLRRFRMNQRALLFASPEQEVPEREIIEAAFIQKEVCKTSTEILRFEEEITDSIDRMKPEVRKHVFDCLGILEKDLKKQLRLFERCRDRLVLYGDNSSDIIPTMRRSSRRIIKICTNMRGLSDFVDPSAPSPTTPPPGARKRSLTVKHERQPSRTSSWLVGRSNQPKRRKIGSRQLSSCVTTLRNKSPDTWCIVSALICPGNKELQKRK